MRLMMQGTQDGLFGDDEPAASPPPAKAGDAARGRVARVPREPAMTQPAGPATAAALAQAPLSVLVITLLRGVLQREDGERAWASLLALQSAVRDHVAVLGLELVIDEAEGYALLRSRPQAGDGTDALDAPDAAALAGPADSTHAAGAPEASAATAGASAVALPRLVPRRPLSYPVSLLLALLRRKLAEVDAGGGDTRVVLSLDDIAETVRVFLPEGPNEARLVDQIEGHVNRVVELGFLRRLKPVAGAAPAVGGASMFEVRRILKAYVDAQWLADFDARLQAYRTLPAADDGGGRGRGRGHARGGPGGRGAASGGEGVAGVAGGHPSAAEADDDR
jgi:hypothetical protein